MGAFGNFRPFIWLVFMAEFLALIADANLGTFEMDLVFPVPGTYAPDALMPVVFAVHNPAFIKGIGGIVEWKAWEGRNSTFSKPIGDLFFLAEEVYDEPGNPVFVHRVMNLTPLRTGMWTLRWSLRVTNCSVPYYTDPDGGRAPYNITVFQRNTAFTISKSGQEPDLVTATSPDKCKNTGAIALNVLSLETAVPDLACGLLAPTFAIANPCAATINSSVAASISAAFTSYACIPDSGAAKVNVTCPPIALVDSSAGLSHTFLASTLLVTAGLFAPLLHLAWQNLV